MTAEGPNGPLDGLTQFATGLIAHVVALVPPAWARRIPFTGVRAAVLQLIERAVCRHPRGYTAPSAFGVQFRGNTRDGIQRYIYVFGVWEPDITAWFQSHLKSGDVVLDVGANIGYYALLASTCVGAEGEVIAFEAVPSIARELKEIIRLNNASVTVHEAAVGSEAGSIEVHRASETNIGHSGTRASESSVSEGVVPQIRLEDTIPAESWDRVRLIKIDVEGAELDVLHGLEAGLARMPSGSALLLEATPDDLNARGQSTAEVFALLDKFGFDAHTIRNSSSPSDYASHDGTFTLSTLTDLPTTRADLVCVKR